MPIVVVGNKSDLLKDRADPQTLGLPYNQTYYKTSAQTGNGVATAFVDLTRRIIISKGYAKSTNDGRKQ